MDFRFPSQSVPSVCQSISPSVSPQAFQFYGGRVLHGALGIVEESGV